MYKLTGVTKDYQKGRQTVAALRGVDLVIEDRDWLAIQGPTGHGKSTSTARTWRNCAKHSSRRYGPRRSASCSRPST
jgi:ABC-type glutathione transport system ATPase component